MAVVVSVDDIVDALEMQLDEHPQFLDRETGKVETVSTELLGLAEEGDEEPEDVPSWQEGEWELAQLIAANEERFLGLPDKFDIHEWQIMGDFARSVEREPLRSELLSAIRGRGAFRMFKDILRRHSRIDEWYEFRTAALRDIAVEWLKENDIAFSDAPNPARRR